MFGGWDDAVVNTIAKFDLNDLTWTKIGKLYQKRHGHSVIAMDDEFLILGGIGTNVAERCRFWHGKLSCAPQEPTLTGYAYNVELFLVPDNFGKYGFC